MSDPTIRDGWPDDWRPTKLQAALAKLDASCDRLDRAARALREAGESYPLAGSSINNFVTTYHAWLTGCAQCAKPNHRRPPARSSVNYFVQSGRAWLAGVQRTGVAR